MQFCGGLLCQARFWVLFPLFIAIRWQQVWCKNFCLSNSEKAYQKYEYHYACQDQNIIPKEYDKESDARQTVCENPAPLQVDLLQVRKSVAYISPVPSE